MIDTTFLRQLDKLNLIIRKRITSSYAGPRQSVSYGRGLVFSDHRQYVPGDDFRTIDWNACARTDDIFVKRYEEERNLTVHILVDASSSMDFGEKIKKFEYASMIGIGFAYMALKNNEKFVFSTFSNALTPFKPRKGTRQLIDTISHLNNVHIKGKTKFLDCINTYKKLIGSRALIVIVSDFIFDLKELEHSLPLFKKSFIILVQVLDPVEKDILYDGDLNLVDLETKSGFRTFLSQRVKENYMEKLNKHTAEIETICNNFGIDFISVTTDKPIFDTFYEILR